MIDPSATAASDPRVGEVPVSRTASTNGEAGARRSRLALVVVAAWAAATLLQAMVLAAQEGLFIVFGLFSSGLYYGLLAGLSPIVWRVCAAMSRAGTTVARQLARHAVMMIGVVGVWLGAYAGIMYALAGPVAVEGQFVRGGLWSMLQSLLVYSIVVSVTLTVQASRRLRRHQAGEAAARLLAREAELGALRAQLRPHVLFNVLNSIYALIPDRPAEAQRMVELVGDLLRKTLDLGAADLITLDEELDLVSSYLEIEQIRLGSNLSVTWQVPEAHRSTLVPPFLIQPLVENAIKHGIARTVGGGAIEVAARVDEEHFVLSIRDRPGRTESGVDPASRAGSEGGGRSPTSIVDGHGFEITRGRLAAWYGDAARLVAGPRAEGFEARIEIARTALDDASRDLA